MCLCLLTKHRTQLFRRSERKERKSYGFNLIDFHEKEKIQKQKTLSETLLSAIPPRDSVSVLQVAAETAMHHGTCFVILHPQQKNIRDFRLTMTIFAL
jgi:hypothetical protein